MCRRGGGFPGHARTDTDFAVTAPSRAASPRRATSAPCPYVPDAVTIGFGSRNGPTETRVSTELASLVVGERPPATPVRGWRRPITPPAGAGRRGGTPGAPGPPARDATTRRSPPRPRARQTRSSRRGRRAPGPL